MKALLATDGSQHSESAALFLSALDLSAEDEIEILHVLKPSPIEKAVVVPHFDLTEIKRTTGAKILEAAANILKVSPAKIIVSMIDGYPDRVIADKTLEKKYNIVVMGSRGFRGIKSLVVGSVARSAAINSISPVLIVKQFQRRETEPLKILLAVDGSEFSMSLSGILSSLPFSIKTEVIILSVIESSFENIPPRYAMEVDERIKEDVARARTIEYENADNIINDVRDIISARYSNIKEIKKVGEPSIEILDAAVDRGVDIIAVGSSGMGGIKGMLGSVSRHILNHSECSVLIGKTPQH